MIDAIYTAMTGLKGNERGLSNISSNVANMNTPGFKGSHVDFTDYFSGGEEGAQSHTADRRGLDSSHVSLDLRSGEIKSTERDLDVAIDGSGFFVVRDENEELHYTRNGRFEFNDQGDLVTQGVAMKVLSRDADGKLAGVSLVGKRNNAPVVTTEVVLGGNLSSNSTNNPTIDNVTVFDKLGGQHALKLVFTKDGATSVGGWTVTVSEGTTQLGTGKYTFTGEVPTLSEATIPLSFANAETFEVRFKLGPDTTSYPTSDVSTLAVKSTDGRTSGQISTLTFDDRGILKIGYSNGQKVDGPTLILAEIQDNAGLVASGNSTYSYVGANPPVLRAPAADMRITAKSIELSNVDLTSEFSSLILMQRGYQASSQVLSTANDMLQQLFEMKGQR